VSGDLAGDLSDMSALLKSYRAHTLVADAKDGRLLPAFQAAFNDYVAKTAGFRALADKGQLQAPGRFSEPAPVTTPTTP
jgi:hypothetical protein